jgi:hypothetical protein
MQQKKAQARTSWMRTLVAWAVSGVVALCLFACVKTELGYHLALREQQALYRQLEEAKQRSISFQARIEQKYSLDLIQEYALNKLHMIPLEGSRIYYLTPAQGDQILDDRQ